MRLPPLPTGLNLQRQVTLLLRTGFSKFYFYSSVSKYPTKKENTLQLSLCAWFSGYRCIFPCVYFYSGYACFCDVYREPGICIWVGGLFLVLGGAVFFGDGLDLVGIFVGDGFSLFYLLYPSGDCVLISRIHHILASRSLTPQTHLVTSTLWLRHRKHKTPCVHPSSVGGGGVPTA